MSIATKKTAPNRYPVSRDLMRRLLLALVVCGAWLFEGCALDAGRTQEPKSDTPASEELAQRLARGPYGSIPPAAERIPRCVAVPAQARRMSAARERYWYYAPGLANEVARSVPLFSEKLPSTDDLPCFNTSANCLSRRYHVLARVVGVFGLGPYLLRVHMEKRSAEGASSTCLASHSSHQALVTQGGESPSRVHSHGPSCSWEDMTRQAPARSRASPRATEAPAGSPAVGPAPPSLETLDPQRLFWMNAKLLPENDETRSQNYDMPSTLIPHVRPASCSLLAEDEGA